MHPNEVELKSLVNTLQLAWDEANNLSPEMGAIKIRTQNTVRQTQNFINGLLGGAMATHEQAEAPPITSILGVAVNRPQPVTPAMLQPDQMEKDKFLQDRDNLYDQFLRLKNDSLYSKMRQPNGEAVIRAVAKKAGIENYADAKLNDLFFNKIREAMKAENDLAQSLAEADKKVKAA